MAAVLLGKFHLRGVNGARIPLIPRRVDVSQVYRHREDARLVEVRRVLRRINGGMGERHVEVSPLRQRRGRLVRQRTLIGTPTLLSPKENFDTEFVPFS